jgi:DNA topoisomerase-1
MIAEPESEQRARLDPLDSRVAAEASGLRYVSDSDPGIRRRRSGKGFSYSTGNGATVGTPTLRRIQALAIPPAWHDVWICSTASGHIQATGRDARGRKQYIYHPAWRAHRDSEKFDSLVRFGRLLPRIRRRVEADLATSGLSRDRVLATAVQLLDATLIRIGNEEYRKSNGSYGLTTLKCRQAVIEGTEVQFVFNGKSGKEQSVSARDRRVARIVQQCQELPGQDLLKYVDEQGDVCRVSSEDVNDYLREASGAGDVTAKTFRTWGASVRMAKALAESGAPSTVSEARKNVVAATATVAAALGNTPAVSRQSYIHPAIASAYIEGTFPHWSARDERVRRNGLDADERFLLKILRSAARERGGKATER